jgi:hypothetical protein
VSDDAKGGGRPLQELVGAPVPTNGIFVKLAVVAFCMALSSSATFWLSFQGGRFANYEGSPSDEAVLYSFLCGLVVSQIITVFLPRGSLFALLSVRFAMTVARSIVVVGAVWLLVAYGMGRVTVALLESGSNATWEMEWCEMTWVFLAASITLLLWHFAYHDAPTPPPGVASTSPQGNQDGRADV